MDCQFFSEKCRP
ncbi:hypothetical protein R3I93_004342 [Phoxinus phoxinus]|uniref:Uncharacterized protein n=1 Tax=Phoxinus phoxinus TaxID=58324 RepID=A0AAN9DK45_9TELE